jgi:hypothetical protein
MLTRRRKLEEEMIKRETDEIEFDDMVPPVGSSRHVAAMAFVSWPPPHRLQLTG